MEKHRSSCVTVPCVISPASCPGCQSLDQWAACISDGGWDVQAALVCSSHPNLLVNRVATCVHVCLFAGWLAGLCPTDPWSEHSVRDPCALNVATASWSAFTRLHCTCRPAHTGRHSGAVSCSMTHDFPCTIAALCNYESRDPRPHPSISVRQRLLMLPNFHACSAWERIRALDFAFELGADPRCYERKDSRIQVHFGPFRSSRCFLWREFSNNWGPFLTFWGLLLANLDQVRPAISVLGGFAGSRREWVSGSERHSSS